MTSRELGGLLCPKPYTRVRISITYLGSKVLGLLSVWKELNVSPFETVTNTFPSVLILQNGGSKPITHGSASGTVQIYPYHLQSHPHRAKAFFFSGRMMSSTFRTPQTRLIGAKKQGLFYPTYQWSNTKAHQGSVEARNPSACSSLS